MGRSDTNRWLIAAARVMMQLGLGHLYAWSVFRIPSTTALGGRSRRSR